MIQERSPLAPRQAAVYRWIAAFVDQHGYAPTLREIGAAMGIASTKGVSDHLVAMRRKGWLDWVPGKSRTILLLDRDTDDPPV